MGKSLNKQSQYFGKISIGNNRNSYDVAARNSTFERAKSSLNEKNSADQNNVFQKVQENIEKLRQNRGKHDEWSIIDIPIKLLRKQTNIKELYGHEIMDRYARMNVRGKSKCDRKSRLIVSVSCSSIIDYMKLEF
jgi:hypothetical protein